MRTPGSHRHRRGGHFSPTTSISWPSPRRSSSAVPGMKTPTSTPVVSGLAAVWNQASARTCAISGRLSRDIYHHNVRLLTAGSVRPTSITGDGNAAVPATIRRGTGRRIRCEGLSAAAPFVGACVRLPVPAGGSGLVLAGRRRSEPHQVPSVESRRQNRPTPAACCVSGVATEPCACDSDLCRNIGEPQVQFWVQSNKVHGRPP